MRRAHFILLGTSYLFFCQSVFAEPAKFTSGEKFVTEHRSMDMGGSGDQSKVGNWRVVKDQFDVNAADLDHIRFTVKTFGGNLHRCNVSGIAIRKNGELKFDDNATQDRCTFRISRSGTTITLVDVNSNCQKYCGARATRSGKTFKKIAK